MKCRMTAGDFDETAQVLYDIEVLMKNKDNLNMTHGFIFNFSINDVYDILSENRNSNSLLTGNVEITLYVCYALLIIFGVVSNFMVCLVVARRVQMRTPRNFYIVNLTVADITTCVIVMPFTLVKYLYRNWTMGSFLCKLVTVVQGTNLFVSIGTITAIALDRYFSIVRRSCNLQTEARVISCIAVIWILSLLVTSPLIFYQQVFTVAIHDIKLYESCMENWPSAEIQLVYSICTLIIEYVIPIVVLVLVHWSIASHLQTHSKTQRDARRARKELERNKKTTILLSLIAVVFAVSWLPYHISLLLLDVYPNYASADTQLAVLAACHILAMTTATTNPILYGWLNTNFRREFIGMLPKMVKKWNYCLKLQQSGGNETVVEKTDDPTTFHQTNNRETTLLLVPVASNNNISTVSTTVPENGSVFVDAKV